MEKKGLNNMIGVSMLIAIGLIVAAIIFSWAGIFFTALAPGGLVECEGLKFEAGFFIDDDVKLEIVNPSNFELSGFVIKEIDAGEVRVIERVDGEVLAGGSESFALNNIDESDLGNKYLIVPGIKGEELNGICKDSYGLEIYF